MSSLLEWAAVLSGGACVYLVVRRSIWNFPLGIISCGCFLVIFVQTRLFGDAALQVAFIVLGFQGWYWWLRGGPEQGERAVERAPLAVLLATLAFVLVGTVGLTYILKTVRGSAPGLDGFTTALSLAAQYLLNRKAIENWYLWMVADVVYVYLYLDRSLHLTAVLYVVFFCMCVWGVVTWRRTLAHPAGPDAAERLAGPDPVVVPPAAGERDGG